MSCDKRTMNLMKATTILFKIIRVDIISRLTDMGYFDAPASISHHGAYEGGLIEHSLAVTKALVEMTEKLGLKWESPRSPYIVGMFHDLCKLDNYYRDSEGNWVYNPDAEPGHGEKSVKMLEELMVLTPEEIKCIKYHMGAFTNKEEWKFYSQAVEMYPNVLYTHTADMIAAHVEGV